MEYKQEIHNLLQGSKNEDRYAFQKANMIIEKRKAEDVLDLINTIKGISKQLDHTNNELNACKNELKQSKKILNEYIKTFGDYKTNQDARSLEEQIEMPETNSYKFYKRVFRMDENHYASIQKGNIITLKIEIEEEGYKILSKKVKNIGKIK